MILLNFLLLLLILILFLKKNKTEKFMNLVDIDNNKKVIDKKYKNIFLESKYWRLNDPNYKYRNDLTNIKIGYLHNELKQILTPLVNNIKIKNFKEIKDKTRLDINIYLELTDKYLSQITNNIYKDLFKIRAHKNIICPNLNTCPISIIDKKVSKFEENSEYYKFTIIVILNIGNKEINHVIKLVILYNKKNKIDNLISLDIIGNLSEDISNLPMLNKKGIIKNNDSLVLLSEYRFDNNDELNIKKKIDVNSKVKKNIEKQLNSYSNKINPEYKCYGSYGDNQLECENDLNLYLKPKKKGVWDRDCKDDDECPFFKKNKNYKNSRGGCIYGRCEMPLGIESLGQRYFNIDTKPLCYNCGNKK